MKITIRQEEKKDYKEVFKVVERAFKGAEHTDGNEQLLVENLRKGSAFIQELSLVAEADGKIVGHILFTVSHVGEDEVLALAPISVLPEYQGKGIGGQLIEKGHEKAREMGYRGVILLGHPTYYPKFGYKEAVEYKIKAPFEIPSEYFMAIELKECSLDGISGVVVYPKEFGI